MLKKRNSIYGPILALLFISLIWGFNWVILPPEGHRDVTAILPNAQVVEVRRPRPNRGRDEDAGPTSVAH